MNHHAPISDAGNVVTLRAFLQQAVDHYPRLVAFSFTVLLPHSATMADSRALIMRFHTEVWRCIGKYSWQRQQARHHSPPTILRWLWEAGCVPESRMIMLMNLDTLDVLREGRLPDSSRLEINAIISNAWRAMAGVDGYVIRQDIDLNGR